jgi:hypothetical protein
MSWCVKCCNYWNYLGIFLCCSHDDRLPWKLSCFALSLNKDFPDNKIFPSPLMVIIFALTSTFVAMKVQTSL